MAVSPLDISGFNSLNPMNLGSIPELSLDKLTTPMTGGVNAPSTFPGLNTGSFGFNVPTISLGLQGLQTLGSLWGSFKALNLANKQFDMQKKFGEANLANSIKSYNTTLADRARARAAFEGQSADQQKAYVDQNKL